MNENKTRRAAARSLAAQVVQELRRTTDDPHTLMAAVRLRDRLRQPSLATILESRVLPGETITAKCHALGIARQTYYSWAQGTRRPSYEQAVRLAETTGIMLADVRRLRREEPHELDQDIRYRDSEDHESRELRVDEDRGKRDRRA
jgi:hypothetical protein